MGWGLAVGLAALAWWSVAKLLPSTGSSAPLEAGGGRWVEVGRETFDRLRFSKPVSWRPDSPGEARRGLPEDALPFADDGMFFARQQSLRLPQAYRISAPFGPHDFLTIEAYSRQEKEPSQLFQVVDDPLVPRNRVLRIASPEHTDGTLIRTSQPLGTRYQICARIGFIGFGTGSGKNGYNGGERNAPWLQESGDATGENGCYFAAIYRTVPQPHNNALAHHLRIAFIDSDNNTEGWTRIWSAPSRQFLASGSHPVVMAVCGASGASEGPNGPPLVTYAAGVWNEPGRVRAVDAYKEDTWYTVCIERFDDRLTLSISGDFRYGGQTTYEATFNDARRIAHVRDPHYWCLGDPHINYYEGSLLVDDVVLKSWRE